MEITLSIKQEEVTNMKQFIKVGILYLSMAALIGMMYPKYCFADGTYRIIIEESGKWIEMPLEEDDYLSIFSAGPDQIKVKSKLLEYLKAYLD